MEAQSTLIYCFFSCYWPKQRHYWCCATGSIHLGVRKHFDRDWGVWGVDDSDGYHNSSWYFHHASWRPGQGQSALFPRCQPGNWWCALNVRKKREFREKVQSANRRCEFWTVHCNLHQEALCCKTLKMDNVMKVVDKAVNIIWPRGLNHRQFDSILREKDHMGCKTTPRTLEGSHHELKLPYEATCPFANLVQRVSIFKWQIAKPWHTNKRLLI